MKYSQTFRWTDRNGRVTMNTAGAHDTYEEAYADALRSARAFGWTPPKWWQWWRWGDYPRSET